MLGGKQIKMVKVQFKPRGKQFDGRMTIVLTPIYERIYGLSQTSRSPRDAETNHKVKMSKVQAHLCLTPPPSSASVLLT